MRAASVTGRAYATRAALAPSGGPSGHLGGEADGEDRSAAGLALHVDPPLERAGDLLADGEPETGPLPVSLGGEEWLEDAPLHLGGHPAPCVGDAQDEVLTLPMRLHL